ncbi:MAG TPA: hypothetical protein DCP07_06975 [Lachnospiraceae bacterium]|nr:hypothetical protein [Lachnospiraceae bacterium]
MHPYQRLLTRLRLLSLNLQVPSQPMLQILKR